MGDDGIAVLPRLDFLDAWLGLAVEQLCILRYFKVVLVCQLADLFCRFAEHRTDLRCGADLALDFLQGQDRSTVVECLRRLRLRDVAILRNVDLHDDLEKPVRLTHTDFEFLLLNSCFSFGMVLYEPVLRIERRTPDATQRLNCFAIGSFEPKIRDRHQIR